MHLHVSFEWEDLFAMTAEIAQQYRAHCCGVSRYIVRRFKGSPRMVGHSQKGYEFMYLIAFSASGVGGIEESVIQSFRASDPVASRCQNLVRGGDGFSASASDFVYLVVKGKVA